MELIGWHWSVGAVHAATSESLQHLFGERLRQRAGEVGITTHLDMLADLGASL